MIAVLSRLSPSLRRYLVIGGSVYVFELLVIALAQAAGASAVLAVALSFWIGLLVSFVLQKIVTFEDKRLKKHIVTRQVALFSLLVVWNFCFTVMVTRLLQFHLPPTICRTLALGITTIWNFYLYKTRIFYPQNIDEATKS